MRQRDVSLDIIRVVACVFVVAMHSPMPSDNANGIFLVALSYFTAPCIGLFFMVSGALLLPVKEEYPTFLKKRFGKVLWPTLFWTVIYIALNIYKMPESVNIIATVMSIPLSAQGNGVLWFMYTLAGLYLLAPILSGWLQCAAKKDIQIVLSLWCVTLCYPIFEQWLMINESVTGILYYFGGYAGYFLLGYYLKKYPDSLSLQGSAIIAGLGVVILLLAKHYEIEIDFYRMFWYLSIFVVALSVTIWKSVVAIVKRVKIMETKLIARLSNLSFGIYLCHILIMREMIWNINWIDSMTNYVLQSALIFVLTFVISAILCELLSRLPFAQALIGYRYSRK